VVLGVIGAWFGLPWVDPVIGLAIAAVIIAVLVGSMRTVVRRLMDGVEDGTLDLIERTAAAVPGVAAVGRTRARWSGHRLEAEVAIAVENTLSVEAGHNLAHAVEEHLRLHVPHLQQATIHVTPAQTATTSRTIP
jgi:cation diffusion facilitator family transporter